MAAFQIIENDYHFCPLTFCILGEKHFLSDFDSLPYLLSLSGDCIPSQD